ncbi:MAG: tyrosine/phenylalanine carboxypeptidase domain-containing protein, partial [Pseudomonadota bacterium]
LDGLIRVHNFLRAMVANGRTDCLLLLFCGKLDLEDIPVLCELSSMGLCKAPRYLPGWASDMRFLLSYLAYSGFLNTINLKQVSLHYENLLRSAPLVEMDG